MRGRLSLRELTGCVIETLDEVACVRRLVVALDLQYGDGLHRRHRLEPGRTTQMNPADHGIGRILCRRPLGEHPVRSECPGCTAIPDACWPWSHACRGDQRSPSWRRRRGREVEEVPLVGSHMAVRRTHHGRHQPLRGAAAGAAPAADEPHPGMDVEFHPGECACLCECDAEGCRCSSCRRPHRRCRRCG